MGLELLGKTLGGYELTEIIGAGSLATVYKARQPGLERWVAVKVLRYQEASTLIRFRREAKAIARLRHRNILIVYEYGEAESWPYIVMEYVEGGTLSDRLKGVPLDWPRVVRLMMPIAEALNYTHQQRIIHRDVKPSNILMPEEDWPLLADFGMVKLPDTDQIITRIGASTGTPAYVSPEQIRGLAVDRRSDMYSLGVIMFEMITGRLPFDYQSANKILLAHLSESLPSPRQFNPDCPANLEQVILRAMQKSPRGRYANMQEMIDAMKQVLISFEHSVSYTTSPVRLPKSRQVTKPFAGSTDPESSDQPADSTSFFHSGPRIFLPEKKITIRLPDKARLIIGRTHRNIIADIDLGPYEAASCGVSRRHACLLRQKEQWLIEDLGSLNGTYVNNIKLKPGVPVPLKDSDVIRCSHLSFTFLTD